MNFLSVLYLSYNFQKFPTRSGMLSKINSIRRSKVRQVYRRTDLLQREPTAPVRDLPSTGDPETFILAVDRARERDAPTRQRA